MFVFLNSCLGLDGLQDQLTFSIGSRNTVKEVPENVVDMFKGFARFAQASYCEEKLLNWTCEPCLDGFTEQSQFVKEFHNTTTEGRAYLAVDYVHRSVVLGFRGTISKENWFYDLKTDFADPFVALGWPSNANGVGLVHEGFLQTYLSIRDQILPLIRRVQYMLPAYNIITTGHSMGAALAALAAIDLHLILFNPPKIISFTYGQPRLGDMDFSRFTNYLQDTGNLKIYRLINENDLIPHLPPSLFGYVHFNTEYWVHRNKTFACTATEGEVSECSSTFSPFFDSNKHVHIYDLTFRMC